MSTLKPSRALRKKGKTSESVNSPLDNHVKLAYNILKNLEDDIVKSPILALSNRMNERFILSSPILRMEGVENTGSQPVKGYLRCAKYSGDLSSWLPPCIVNPRKLCPICPSTDMELEQVMEIDNDDMVTDAQESSTTQKKCTRKSTTEKSSIEKKKTTNKDDVSTMLKKLIEELLTNIPDTEQAEKKNEDATRNVINRYFAFGEALYLRYKELKSSYGKDGAKTLIEEEVRKQIPEMKFSDEALRKRRGDTREIFKFVRRTRLKISS
ncbi:hypothetical protein C1646_775956 [Rhizophagus diaphanus]|nr:hypothetical protein C1646_775956 [Rhizophagus diaphanus] [Rhizophagus sp. MUCL 43196]